MKKLTYLAGCLAIVFAASCGGSDKPKTDATDTKTESTASSGETGDAHKGKQLIDKSDCLGCHNETNKVVGPAYVEVAAKYPMSELNVDELADKIIRGGSGVWGDVPMTPHPNLSKEDAKEMVNYILSLKK